MTASQSPAQANVAQTPVDASKMTREDVRNHLQDSSTPGHVLHAIAQHHPDFHYDIATHDNAQKETLEHIYNASPAHRAEAAAHRNSSKAIVDRHIKSLDSGTSLDTVDRSVLLHPHATPEVRDAKVREILRDRNHESYWDSQRLAEEYPVQAHAPDPEVVASLRGSGEQSVAHAALASSATPIHDQKAWADLASGSEVNSFLERGHKISPEFMEHLWESHKSKVSGNREDSDESGNLRNFMEHPSATQKMLEEVATKPASEFGVDPDSWRWGSATRNALMHDSFPHAKRVEALSSPDEAVRDAAKYAVIRRPESTSEDLRLADPISLPEARKYRQTENLKSFLLHPNIPQDLLIKGIKSSSEGAKVALGRRLLGEAEMKALIDHKNQSVALDALKHRSITPELVNYASKRRAEAVAKAAASHPLASADLALQKATSNPSIAADMAGKSSDPEVLSKLHDAFPDSQKVSDALLKNSNTPHHVVSAVAGKYISAGKAPDLIRHAGASHPAYSASHRAALLPHHPGVAYHPDLTDEEIREHVDLFNQNPWGLNDSSDRRENYLRNVLHRENLSPEMAKSIVTGSLGSMGGSRSLLNSELNHTAVSRPHIFTREVVKAGLGAPDELIGLGVKRSLAKSPALTADDIDELYDADKTNRSGLTTDFVAHPNASARVIRAGLSGDSGGEVKAAAISNPSIDDDILKETYRTTERSGHLSSSPEFGNNLSEQVKKRGLLNDALETTDSPALMEHLLGRGRYWSRPKISFEHFQSAASNSNPEAVESLVRNVYAKDPYSVGRDNPEATKALLHRLSEHDDERVRDAVFPHLTGEQQAEYIKRRGAASPEVIRNLNREGLAGIKITPETESEVVQAILSHGGASDEHREQALNHSGWASDLAITPDWHESQKMSDFVLRAVKRHNHLPTLQAIASKASDPELIKEVVSGALKHASNRENTRAVKTVFGRLADNKNISSSDLDSLASLKGEEHSGIFNELANHKKTSVKLLQHIVDNYGHEEDTLRLASGHPKAASAKVLRAILARNNEASHVALVDNPKIPEGIKDELLKNPRVLFAARSDSITPESLRIHSQSSDPEVLHSVAAHPSSDEKALADVVDRVRSMKAAGGVSDSNQEKLDLALKAAALQPSKLDKKTQLALADESPTHVTDMLTFGSKKLSPDIVLHAMNKHGGSESRTSDSYRKMLATLCAYGGSDDSRVHDRLIESIALDDKLDSETGSRSLFNLAAISKLKPEQYHKILQKIKAARPEGHEYSDQHQKDTEGLLLSKIARHGSAESLDELSSNPHLHQSVTANKNATQKHLDDVIQAQKDSTKFDFEDLVGHKNITSEQLEKLFDPIMNQFKKDRYTAGGAQKALYSSRKLSERLIDRILDHHAGSVYPDNSITPLAKNPRLSKEHLKRILSQARAGVDSDVLSAVGYNPNFSLNDIRELQQDAAKQDRDPNGPDGVNESVKYHRICQGLAANPFASSDDLREISQNESLMSSRNIKASLTGNPKTPEDVLRKMIQDGQISSKEALKSPAIGTKIWAEMQHPLPNLSGLKAGNEINEATFIPSEQKIGSVVSQIPEGGHIEWAQFKKANPGLAANPLINKMFVSAPKQRLTKDHAERFIKEMPSKKFHVSYRTWDGIQRHNDARQLVVQINNGPSQHEAVMKDPARLSLYRMIQDASNHSGHPVNEQNIGWSRVDTSDPNHWFIDEIQSDFNSNVSRQIKQLQDEGRSSFLEDRGIDPDQAPQVVDGIVDAIGGWEQALLKNVVELAKKHGVKKVSIHSGASKTLVNKGEAAEVTNKYDKLYNKLPQEMGFKADRYDNLPSANPKNSLMGQNIWTLELPDSEDPNQLKLFDKNRSGGRAA